MIDKYDDDRFHGVCPVCGQQFLLEMAEELDNIKKITLEMFEADASCGCGFYNTNRWRQKYVELQMAIGCKLNTSAYDNYDEVEK